jgi:hypothetical protein
MASNGLRSGCMDDLSIAVVTFEGAEEQDVVGPYEMLWWMSLFQDLPSDRPIAESDFAETFYSEAGATPPKVFTVAPTTDTYRMSSGMRFTPDFSYDNAPAANMVVAPGGRGAMNSCTPKEWNHRLHQTGRNRPGLQGRDVRLPRNLPVISNRADGNPAAGSQRLLIRECFYGSRCFGEFEQQWASPPISPPSACGVFPPLDTRAHPHPDRPARYQYRLTDMDLKLHPRTAAHAGPGRPPDRLGHVLCAAAYGGRSI